MKTDYKYVWGALSVFIVAALASALVVLVFFRLDIWIEDYVTTTQNDWPDPQDIVLVTVSEDTLATLQYRSPIDREFLATIVSHIDNAGARAIGLDILIDQKSEIQKDQRFQSVLENAKAPIVIGFADVDDSLTKNQTDYLEAWTENLKRGLVTLQRDDFDGAIRQTYLGRQVEGVHYDGLAGALAKEVGATNPVPSARISYFTASDGKPFPFPTYPAHSVTLLPADWFKNKIVLIGSTLPTADLHRTPFSTTQGTQAGSLFGVAIHAHILAQTIAGHKVQSLSGPQSFTLVLITSLLAGAIATLSIRPLLRISMLVLLFVILVVIGWVLFRQMDVLVPLATPIIAGLLASAVIMLREWRQDRMGRHFVENAFSKYVSPAVVRRIVANREDLKLGGELRRVTYVFTDLQGFTTMCEGLEPEEVALLLNEYLDHMCSLFIEHSATLDKIIGDAVVGFFGAPEEQVDQCSRAVDLALAIDKFAEQYKARKRAEGFALGATRIGVHCGEAVVGNFGGNRFVDYTSIGDTVNSAARMEAANKLFGTRICVSEAVVRECPSHAFRPIGDLVLRGKNKKLTCFEPKDSSHVVAEQLEAYKDAYSAMERGDKDAMSKFSVLAKEHPNDPLLSFHHNRLQSGESGSTIVL